MSTAAALTGMTWPIAPNSGCRPVADFRTKRAFEVAVKSEDVDERDFRLAMAERAVEQLRTRLDELAQSLAALTGQAPPPPNQAFTIDATHLSELFSGFYPCEDDADSRPFRWTGSADFFEFRVNLDRNLDWRFNMLIRFPSQRPEANLLAFADYIPIPTDIDRAAGAVTGAIPRRPFSNQLCLSFHCDRHFSPRESDPKSEDDRRLALSFYAISFSPLQPVGEAEPLTQVEADEIPA
jgi:hypothetical protein